MKLLVSVAIGYDRVILNLFLNW